MSVMLWCAGREAMASGGAATSAGACAECLTAYGADPQVATVLAVVVGVVVRLGIDWIRERRSQGDSNGSHS